MRPAPALPFLLVTVFIDILGLGLVVPIAPQLITSLGGESSRTLVYYGLLNTAFGLCQFLTAPLLGSLSDRYGRRPVLLISLATLGLDYLGHALTPVLWLLFFSHALAGATAGTYTVVNAYLADVTAPEHRARAYGKVGAAFSLGFIAGPAIGGLLGGVSLRAPFYLAAALALANVCYGLCALPESRPGDRDRPVAWRLVNPAAALGELTRRAGLAALAWHRLCGDVARQILQVLWILFVTHQFGWSTRTAGLVMAGSALANATVQAYLSARVVHRLGERRSVIIGTVLSALTMIGYAFARADWVIYPLLFVASLAGIGAVAAQSWTSRLIPNDEQGRVQGAFTSIGSFTEAVVPTLAASLFAWSVGNHAGGLAFVCAAAFLLIGALVVARAETGPGHPPTSPGRPRARATFTNRRG